MDALLGYKPLEIGGGPSIIACAQVVTSPTLAGKITTIKRECKSSVSEIFQSGCEPYNIWCRNILADHPPRSASSDQGKEVSGEVGTAAWPIGPRTASGRTGIAPDHNVNFTSLECSDVIMPLYVWPMALEYFHLAAVALDLPLAGHSAAVES
jgi:hypothetical protein